MIVNLVGGGNILGVVRVLFDVGIFGVSGRVIEVDIVILLVESVGLRSSIVVIVIVRRLSRSSDVSGSSEGGRSRGRGSFSIVIVGWRLRRLFFGFFRGGRRSRSGSRVIVIIGGERIDRVGDGVDEVVGVRVEEDIRVGGVVEFSGNNISGLCGIRISDFKVDVLRVYLSGVLVVIFVKGDDFVVEDVGVRGNVGRNGGYLGEVIFN